VTLTFEEIAERIRILFRAKAGLRADEDQFSGLLNVKDRRERTRLSTRDVYGHSILMLLAEMYPFELAVCGSMAAQEDAYFISEEGEGRREALLAKYQTSQAVPGQVTNIALPQVITRPEEQNKPPEKKGWFHR
jgi:hypothetical protein